MAEDFQCCMERYVQCQRLSRKCSLQNWYLRHLTTSLLLVVDERIIYIATIHYFLKSLVANILAIIPTLLASIFKLEPAVVNYCKCAVDRHGCTESWLHQTGCICSPRNSNWQLLLLIDNKQEITFFSLLYSPCRLIRNLSCGNNWKNTSW